MANRNFQQFQGTMERAVVKLFLKATFASGVPTLVSGTSRGIKSIARTAAGAFTITLGTTNPSAVDKYQSLLSAQASFISATGLPAAPLFAVVADDVADDGTIDVLFSDAETPAATDPADADTLLLELTLLNTGDY